MLKKQKFNMDKYGNYAIENTFDISETLNYVNSIRQLTKGWTEEKTIKLKCSIPACMYYNEPLLIEFQKYNSADPIYARKCLDKWLSEHPEFRV